MISQDLIVFHLDTHEWVKLQLKQSPVTMLPVIQGGCCAVIPPRNLKERETYKVRKVRLRLICVERCDLRRYILFWRQVSEWKTDQQAEVLQACYCRS